MIDPITQLILEQHAKNIALAQFRKAFPAMTKKVSVTFHGTPEHKKMKQWWKTVGAQICKTQSKTPQEKKECLKFAKSQR